MATKFQLAIEAVLKGHGLLDKFQTQTDFHVHIEQIPYEPLVIERHGELISVAHYFKQNGDLICDPDVELHFPDWTPTAIQLCTGQYDQKFIERDGKTFVNMRFDPSVLPFLTTWAKNIVEQKWADPRRVKAIE